MEYLQNRSRCSKCISKYAIFDREPDCEQLKCPYNYNEFEKLDLENIVALGVWRLVYNQVLMSMDGAIDLNIVAITEILKLIDMPNNQKLEIVNTIMECWRYF